VLLLSAWLPAAVVQVNNTQGLKQAAARATAGTRIVLAPGRYEGNCKIGGLRGDAGSDGMVEIVAKDPLRPPIFDGGEVAFQLIDCAYVLVEGIIAQAATVNNIQVGDGSHHIILKDCVSRDIAVQSNCDGIKLPGLTDFLLYNCRLENWGGEGSAIDMVGCARGLLYGCRFSYPNVKGTTANAIQPKGGTHSLGIYKCVFEDASFRAVQFGGSTGKQYFFQGNYASGYEGLDMVAIGNVIRGGECAVAFVSCTRCRFEFNTIIDPTGYVIRVLHEGASKPAADNTFSHNLIVYGQVREVLGRGGPSDLASFDFVENYWYNRLKPEASIPRLPVEQDMPKGGRDPQMAGNGQPAPTSPARMYGAFSQHVAGAMQASSRKFEWAMQQALRFASLRGGSANAPSDR
jgi:hypothetical protein